MKKYTAHIISFVFHPVVLATFAPFVVIYHATHDVLYGLKWTGFTILFVLCVLVVLYLLRPKDFFTDFDISKKEKRPLFYTICFFFAVLYFSIAVILKTILFPLSLVALGIIIGLVIFELANIYIKVSVHAAVSTGFVITIGVLYGMTAFLCIFWIPFAVVWSRLILKKHTRQEIMGGTFIGFIITLVTFAIAEVLL